MSCGARRINTEEICRGMDTILKVSKTEYGNGLFASEEIPVSAPICWYTSSTGDEVKPLSLSERMYAVACDYDGSSFVDGTPDGPANAEEGGAFTSGCYKVGGYANSPFGRTKTKANCRLMDITAQIGNTDQTGRRWLILYSSCSIDADQEVLLDYGKNYTMM